MQLEHDVRIDAGEWATVWSFTPVTEKAKKFVADFVPLEDWQRIGDSFAVDHRPARQLAKFMTDDGLVVWHPSYGVFIGRP